ncbi:DUF4429 domain-containing protein [Streptomyces sp. NPDC048057]|uniref:DUF4429 domain-containing protein n=1 Tax=Streptomyces sp. NPDC048057 TaxID=3155628 RepID=UPI00340C204A
MAEIIQKDGTWTFDGDTVRIVPGFDKGVGLLRRTLGELAVPLEAVAGASFEPGRRSGRLRLRLRNGADPLLQLTGGRLRDGSDPYALSVDNDRSGVAEYFVDEVRNALVIEQIDADPTWRYLLPGPPLPISASAGDATVDFDGEQIRLTWNWKTEESKASGGPRTVDLVDVHSVDWQPSGGLENGFLRFGVAKDRSATPAKYDPYAVDLWGFRKDPLMALVGAAVVARLPHPYAPAEPAAALAAPAPSLTKAATPEVPPAAAADSADGKADGGDRGDRGDETDALLRRLRELGELHRTGILTDDEFSTAKQALLKRL